MGGVIAINNIKKKKKKDPKIFKDTHGWMGNKLWTFLLNNKFINGLETKQ